MVHSSMAADCFEEPVSLVGNAVAKGTYFGQNKVNEQDASIKRDTCLVDRQEFEGLKTQATRLEQMLQVMPAGVVVIDGKGTVRQANNLARQLLGEPLEGQIWREIIVRSFRPQADDGHEVSLHDGRKVKLSISPLVGEPGQMIVMTDLTETRQLQQRISHMQRLSSLGKTIASLVHQIRTPLSAAMLYAANLKGKNLNEQARSKFADKLHSRLEELEHQVNDMLLFAKSGEQQVVQKISVEQLFAEVASGAEAMLEKHQANVVIRDQVPDSTITGNLSALVGAIHNLIHNALQVKPEGAKIELVSRVNPDKSNYIDIMVNDDGPGIEPSKLTNIFEPFFTTRSQGTGLGLAVVQSVAKSHKGMVSANNLKSKGASFTITLPVSHELTAVVQAETVKGETL